MRVKSDCEMQQELHTMNPDVAHNPLLTLALPVWQDRCLDIPGSGAP